MIKGNMVYLYKTLSTKEPINVPDDTWLLSDKFYKSYKDVIEDPAPHNIMSF